MMETLDTRIRAMLSGSHFVLIGAGQLGEMAISLWPSAISLPSVILDSNRTGQCRGIDIIKLQEYRAVPAPVFLLSAFKLRPQEVTDIFARLGQDVILTVYDFFEQHCPNKFSNGWRCLSPNSDKWSRLDSARECFADERSLGVLDASIDWRYRRKLAMDFECEPESTKYDLRRYPVKLGAYDAVFDCGAYDLSLAGYLSAAGLRTKLYVAFEPDDISFERCMAALDSLAPLTPEMVLVEKIALFEDDANHIFLEGGLLSSRLAPKSSKELPGSKKSIRTMTLDGYIQKFHPACKGRILLKLHVEGAEFSVLRGAETLIRAAKPDIFVNLSHDETSLLEIPPFLRAIGGYKIYLAGHSLFGEGLTLFATQFSKEVSDE